jgi:uncharacterized DUF497 family protein
MKFEYDSNKSAINKAKHGIDGVGVEAAKIGVTRTSLIKMWVSQQLLSRT